MSVKRTPRTEPFFRGLADFLNTAHRGMTEKQWQSFLKRIEKNPIGSYFHSHSVSLATNEARKMQRVTFQEAQEIRAEMHGVALGYLRSEERLDWPFSALVACLKQSAVKDSIPMFSRERQTRAGQSRTEGKRQTLGIWILADCHDYQRIALYCFSRRPREWHTQQT